MGCIADSRHNRGRGCQHKRAGTKYNKDRYCADDLAGEQPGQHSSRQGYDNNPGCPAVCQADNLCLAGIRRLHQADHALDGTVLPYLAGSKVNGTKLIDRTAGHAIAGRFVHRHGFPGHDRLVHRSLTGNDDAIHRDGFPGQHTHQISHPDLFRGQNIRLPVMQDTGGARRQFDKFLNTGARTGDREFLQQGAKLHDKSNFTGCEVLPDDHRRNKGDRDKDIRLDIKGSDQPMQRFQQDRNTAQQNGHPGRVNRQVKPPKNADKQRYTRYRQEGNVSPGSAPFVEFFNPFGHFFHLKPPLPIPGGEPEKASAPVSVNKKRLTRCGTLKSLRHFSG